MTTEYRTSDLQCIHRAGCTKPKVCGEVGHCTSMTETDLKLHADMSREEVDAVMTRTAAAPSSKQQLENANVLWQEVSRQLKAGIGVPSIMLNRVHWRSAIEEVERLREERRVADETTDVLKTIYRLAGGHAIECQCRQCEIFELLEPIVGNSSRSAVDPPVAHKHWCAKLAPSVYTAMDCNCGAVEPAERQHVVDHAGDCKSYCWCKMKPEKASDDPWTEERKNCTCPKPGTSNSQIDPMCPISFPHPWARPENGKGD